MSDRPMMDLAVYDEPALIVTTGQSEIFIFADNGLPEPEVTGVRAAVLVTRLRWWADRIESKAAMSALIGRCDTATERPERGEGR